jgi:hypothetical protein
MSRIATAALTEQAESVRSALEAYDRLSLRDLEQLTGLSTAELRRAISTLTREGLAMSRGRGYMLVVWLRPGVLAGREAAEREPADRLPTVHPSRPASTSQVRRRGAYVGTPFHYRGQNWICIREWPSGDSYTLKLRRYQDGREETTDLGQCSRPAWWKDAA